MKSNTVTVCLCIQLFLAAWAHAQKTEVNVRYGKVRAETNTTQTDINAGRKVTILPDSKPVVTVSNPLVDDVMKLYQWVEEEKLAQRQRIDTFNIKVIRLDGDEVSTLAYLAEFPNYKSRASKSFTLNSGLLDETEFYDLEGNLLSYELERTSDTHGRYTITSTQTVAPGENFKFISVAKKQVHVDIDANGILRHLRPAWNTPYCLNFCRVILPPSAIFVESSRPVIALENSAGRIAVTSRAYNGPMADGKFHFAFLWPEKDKTSLADVPSQFRGLHDKQKETIDEEYRKRTAAIHAGQPVHDQSTPLLAMLSLYSAATHKNKQQLIDLIANPDIKNSAIEYTDEVFDYVSQGLGTYAFLSTPPYREFPRNGDKHPIQLCRQGSLLHEATVEMVFQDDKWYFSDYEVVWRSNSQSDNKKTKPDEEPSTTSPSLPSGIQVAHWTLDGHAQDQSTQGFHGSLKGKPQWVRGIRNFAVGLDLEEDYISLPPLHLNTDTLTITLWVRTKEIIMNPGLVFTRNGSRSAGLWFNADNELRYNWNDDAATWCWSSQLQVPNKTWTFAALVVDPQQATIYMHDGTTMKSASHAHDHSIATFDGTTYIGHDPRWGTVKGAIDEVRIYNYALDPSEIERIYLETKAKGSSR